MIINDFCFLELFIHGSLNRKPRLRFTSALFFWPNGNRSNRLFGKFCAAIKSKGKRQRIESKKKEKNDSNDGAKLNLLRIWLHVSVHTPHMYFSICSDGSRPMTCVSHVIAPPGHNGWLNVSIFEVLTGFYELWSYAQSSIKRFNKNYDTFRILYPWKKSPLSHRSPSPIGFCVFAPNEVAKLDWLGISSFDLLQTKKEKKRKEHLNHLFWLWHLLICASFIVLIVMKFAAVTESIIFFF